MPGATSAYPAAWLYGRSPSGLGAAAHTDQGLRGSLFLPVCSVLPLWPLRGQLPGSAVLPLLSSRPGTAPTGGARNRHGGPPALPGGLCLRDPTRSHSAASGRRPCGALGCEVPGRTSGSLKEASRAHTDESPTAGPECPGGRLPRLQAGAHGDPRRRSVLGTPARGRVAALSAGQRGGFGSSPRRGPRGAIADIVSPCRTRTS